VRQAGGPLRGSNTSAVGMRLAMLRCTMGQPNVTMRNNGN